MTYIRITWFHYKSDGNTWMAPTHEIRNAARRVDVGSISLSRGMILVLPSIIFFYLVAWCGLSILRTRFLPHLSVPGSFSLSPRANLYFNSFRVHVTLFIMRLVHDPHQQPCHKISCKSSSENLSPLPWPQTSTIKSAPWNTYIKILIQHYFYRHIFKLLFMKWRSIPRKSGCFSFIDYWQSWRF